MTRLDYEEAWAGEFKYGKVKVKVLLNHTFTRVFFSFWDRKSELNYDTY